MHKKLVGFAGAKAAGKTTAAKYLAREHGFVIKSFSTPLKDFLLNFMEFTPEQVYTLEGKEAVDPRYRVSPRRVMEAFGTDFIRETIPDFWVTRMRSSIYKSTDELIAVDDIRFDDEAKLIRQLGGIVVHIEGRGLNMKQRKHWFWRWFLPRSERGIAVKSGDIVIDNSGLYTELQRQIRLNLL